MPQRAREAIEPYYLSISQVVHLVESSYLPEDPASVGLERQLFKGLRDKHNEASGQGW